MDKPIVIREWQFENWLDIQECGQLCIDNPNCNSFEYSARQQNCYLNNAAEPNNKKYQDYEFCSKIGNDVHFKSYLAYF